MFSYREVPLNAEVRTALDAWLQQRKDLAAQRNESALFLTKQGTRLATRTIDDVVRRLGQEADLSLSAHILRHTCLTSLVRLGNDLVLVAELAGHKRLETNCTDSMSFFVFTLVVVTDSGDGNMLLFGIRTKRNELRLRRKLYGAFAKTDRKILRCRFEMHHATSPRCLACGE